ncbi:MULTISPECIES: tRNA uridine-5-carboxymethylaminomethyl(34) synthesis GTPase MnmE [unclassified Polynucleobacter]|uniref:tRNA uridine-5-carboxymethylaminomethyl(34) synthesis GTPase MnmE n=1 Tax=unclassified Polynucleobacter TaxID=2640945 RepID=UPI00257454E2|nr:MULTISPECIES: tRNA uridine-5-carboxymethylaminomethyl(34) synthesis GTPase MnmE [unclassified Polynucleobacter]BEI43627.1 tRNA uridine-5-carboxymethylaminomethyl(34) synthesis GTPase MnmE [Polynucleobacter sp. HIN10]BEI45401.1 tRNA uridine-5-carboxymethylaminomethyl(34) synthesis GTPase MnmE [Polynucleobacter sp. HIN11]
MHKNPIAAIATPRGAGGVGIVRVSGPDLIGLAKIFLGSEPKPRFAHYLVLKDAHQEQIDQVLLLYFKAPASFTGEDVLELHCHGGARVTQLVLNRVMELGAPEGIVLAGPGEFSLRAYLNGKIDLVQAEAIADLINAQTDAAIRGANLSLQGRFSDQINELIDQITQLRILVESTLDFPEEEIEFIEAANAQQRLEKIMNDLEQIIQTSRQGKILRDGIRLALVGSPNVGKSSLLNALVGEERAIVTPIAGTTRDRIIENISIDGIPVHVIDTAGIRESNDVVEQIGVAQTWDEIARADIVLLIHDVTQAPEANFVDIEKAVRERVHPGAHILDVMNKLDLLEGQKEGHTKIGLGVKQIFISAKTGEGISRLQETILRFAGWEGNAGGGIYTARSRHLRAIGLAKDHLQKAMMHGFGGNRALELFAEELHCAQNCLGEITGKLLPDDLLGKIFSEFCIGK